MTTDKPEDGLKRKPTRYSSVLLQRAGEPSVSSNVVILSDEFDKYASDVDALLAAKDEIIQNYAEGVERLTPLANIGRLAVEWNGQCGYAEHKAMTDVINAYRAAQRETGEEAGP